MRYELGGYRLSYTETVLSSYFVCLCSVNLRKVVSDLGLVNYDELQRCRMMKRQKFRT